MQSVALLATTMVFVECVFMFVVYFTLATNGACLNVRKGTTPPRVFRRPFTK